MAISRRLKNPQITTDAFEDFHGNLPFSPVSHIFQMILTGNGTTKVLSHFLTAGTDTCGKARLW
uniref:Uncharacterized protein n=1 Tax=Romanomermis culicivorax TaxID=13658 RepID=A0A915J6J6_ROMCU